MHSLPMDSFDRMIAEMKDLGLRDIDMSSGLGVSRQRWNGWKARESIPKNMLEAVSDFIDVNLLWLMTGEGPKKPVHDIRHAQQVLARRRARAHDEAMEPEADAYCTAQWEIDAIKALRGMDDDRRRRALQDLADGAELERLKRAGSHD